MTTLFTDDFESGDLSNWTGTNGTIAAAAGAAHTGAFGCEANSNDAFAYKDFTAPASAVVSHRADVTIVSASGSGQFRILQISQGTIQVALLFYDNGAYKLRLRNSDNTLQETAVSGIVAGSWQELRIDYDWSAGQDFTAQAFVDGVAASALLTNATVAGTIWQASRVFVLTFEDVATGAGHLYFDNVATEDAIPSGTATYTEAGQAASAAAASGADAWTMADAGQALAAWTGSALDTMTMTDAGGGVLVAVASGSDGSTPAVELPYQGDTAVYSSAGATGSISGGTVQSADAAYSGTSATGSISGATVMPPEGIYG